eukprot:GAHX01003041.1.p1 GENE.GAHX01003041.1~~GAHX01003041.1.p1  ORF type:complete len:421 (-),score=70.82 GAHX01003041.1:507-1646(-)
MLVSTLYKEYTHEKLLIDKINQYSNLRRSNNTTINNFRYKQRVVKTLLIDKYKERQVDVDDDFDEEKYLGPNCIQLHNIAYTKGFFNKYIHTIKNNTYNNTYKYKHTIPFVVFNCHHLGIEIVDMANDEQRYINSEDKHYTDVDVCNSNKRFVCTNLSSTAYVYDYNTLNVINKIETTNQTNVIRKCKFDFGDSSKIYFVDSNNNLNRYNTNDNTQQLIVKFDDNDKIKKIESLIPDTVLVEVNNNVILIQTKNNKTMFYDIGVALNRKNTNCVGPLRFRYNEYGFEKEHKYRMSNIIKNANEDYHNKYDGKNIDITIKAKEDYKGFEKADSNTEYKFFFYMKKLMLGVFVHHKKSNNDYDAKIIVYLVQHDNDKVRLK